MSETTIDILRKELIALEEDNSRLRQSLAQLQDTLDDWRTMAAVKQAECVQQMSTPDTVSVTLWRLKVVNGGYQAARLLALVGGVGTEYPLDVFAAFDEYGEGTGLTREEEIVALCHASGGWYQPPKHT